MLGGHSAGASTAVGYADWDFAGRAGWRDLDGLVLIDGGLLGSFNGDRGIFAQVGALNAYERPDAPSTLQTLPLLPAELKPAFP